MKLSVTREALAAALTHVARVVERRNTVPILSNIMISAAPGKLELRSTDLDMLVTTLIDANVTEAGETTVNATTFDALIKKQQQGAEVTIQLEDQQLLIKAGRSRSKLPTLPAADFPDFAAGQFTHTMKMQANLLATLIDKTSFAISTEETRYYLNGIFFHCPDEPGTAVLRGVATDGHRLAQHQFPAPEGAAGMPGIILPRKAVGEIAKLLSGMGKDEIMVEVSPTKIRVTTKDTVLASKLIDGTFPDYGRVVPLGNNLVAVADRWNLAGAADRVSTVSSDKGRAVKLSFKDGSVELSVRSPDTGDATEEFDVNFEGALDIGVNSKYLAEILGNMKSDEVRIAMADPGSPMLFTAEGEDGSSLWVLMPMRI